MEHLLKDGQCAAIFNTPDYCEECPCCHLSYLNKERTCNLTKKVIEKNLDWRPSWCPLAIKQGGYIYAKTDKEIPKRPYKKKYLGTGMYTDHCPNCSRGLDMACDGDCCPDCGQKLDWSYCEKEEN